VQQVNFGNRTAFRSVRQGILFGDKADTEKHWGGNICKALFLHYFLWWTHDIYTRSYMLHSNSIMSSTSSKFSPVVYSWIVFVSVFTTLIPQMSGASPHVTDNGHTRTYSILVPPPRDIEKYSKNYASLSKTDRWKIKMHGLRYSALHPEVWGIRRGDITLNKNLVSIKPFYYRPSESPHHTLSTIELEFSYPKVKRKVSSRGPETMSAVFDVGIAGTYVTGIPGSYPRIDKGYVIRFSSLPENLSGIYFKNRRSYYLLSAASKDLLKTGKIQKVRIAVSEKGVSVTLNGREFANIVQPGLRQGLVSLISDWHPVKLSHLKITGTVKSSSGEERQIVSSGLVKIPQKKSS